MTIMAMIEKCGNDNENVKENDNNNEIKWSNENSNE